MPSFPDLATQAGLVIFAQALAFMATPAVSNETGAKPAVVMLDRAPLPVVGMPFALMPAPIEVPGTVVAGKLTDRLVPADTDVVAQSNTTDRAQGSKRARPGRPSAEAIDACRTKQKAATCSFAGRNGDAVEGLCRPGPRGEPAACMPAGNRPPRQRS